MGHKESNQTNKQTNKYYISIISIFFLLFLNQNICCGYSQWDYSFVHQICMLKLLDKERIQF